MTQYTLLDNYNPHNITRWTVNLWCIQGAAPVKCDSCSGGTGDFLPTSGVCQCHDVPDLDTICNSECRQTSPQLRFNAVTRQLETYDPVTGVSTPVSSTDNTTILGTLSCVANGTSSCNVVNVQTTGSAFSGTYDANLPTPLKSRRRRLAETSTGIPNPMLCLQKGDSIMFAVTNESYPVYAKDSLMNTNPAFDYGAFRTLEEKLKSNSLSISAFAFSFVEAGIYVFVLSNNKAALTIVSVMDTGVKCPTDGPIVPLNQANLIKLNAKPSNDIILAPDWALIAGLLVALFGVVAGLIFGLYYFRRKSWVGKQTSTDGYKNKARGFNLTNLTSKGSVVKKTAKPVNENVSPDADLEAKPPKQDETSGDYQPQLNRWDDDDLAVRELVDRLQFHHDSVEKAFHDQETGAAKMMKLLQNEADELKRLLASLVVAQSKEKEPEGCEAELVLVESLEKCAAARADFEAQQRLAEDNLLISAKALAQVVQGKDVVGTILDEMLTTNGQSNHLNAISAELKTLTKAINSNPGAEAGAPGVWPTLESEQNRRKVDAAIWNAFGKTTRELLPPELLELRKRVLLNQSECDEKAAEVCENLLKFSALAPAYAQKLDEFKATCMKEIQETKEQQNPALLKPLKAKQEKILQGLLKEMQSGAGKLAAKIETDQKKLREVRSKCQPEALVMQQQLDALKIQLDQAKVEAPNPAQEVSELVAQLRTLLANPVQFQLAQPPVAMTQPILDLDDMLASTESMAEPPMDGDGGNQEDDMAVLQQLMDKEIEKDLNRDQNKVSAMQADFMAMLDSNESLTADERQALLDEFNEDMAQLQASLELERHKQEEKLRNRLAIRQLKEEQQADSILEDQALELAMRQKQELELKELERAFAEEQAKIDQEFGQKLDLALRKSSTQISRQNTVKLSQLIADEAIVESLKNEFDDKWNDLQRELDNESLQAKTRLDARKKARAAHFGKSAKGSDSPSDLMATLSAIEVHSLDRNAAVKHDILFSEYLSDQVHRGTLAPSTVLALSNTLNESAEKWNRRVQDLASDESKWSFQWSQLKREAITPELLQLNTKMHQHFQSERSALTSAQLLEKCHVGSLSPVEESALLQMQKNFKSKWESQVTALMEEERQLKQKGISSGNDDEDVILADAELAMVNERVIIASIGAAMKTKALEKLADNFDNDEVIKQIQDQFEEDWQLQKTLLKSECDIKRKQLQDRIKRRRLSSQPTNESPTIDAQDKFDVAKLENEIRIQEEALANSIFADKARLEALTPDDQQQIEKILNENSKKWTERQILLQDEAAAARASLCNRLKDKQNKAAEWGLNFLYKAREDALVTAATVELALLGCTTDEVAKKCEKLKDEHVSKWVRIRTDLDNQEAKCHQNLIAENAPEGELHQLELDMDVLRSEIAMLELNEKMELLALHDEIPEQPDINEKLIQQLHDDHKKKWKEYSTANDDEVERLRKRLQDRLAKKKKSKEEIALLEKDTEKAVDNMQKQEQLVGFIKKANNNQLTSDDSDAIRKLRENYEREVTTRKNELRDEEQRLKANLADRIKAKRDVISKQKFDNPAARAQAVLQLAEEERLEAQQLEHQLDIIQEKNHLQEVQTEALLLQLMSDNTEKANNDDDTITRLNAEHEAKWLNRMRELDDEETRLRNQLHDRLSRKRKKAESLPLLEKQEAEKALKGEEDILTTEIERQMTALKEQEQLKKMLEKSQLGLITDVDEAAIEKMQKEYQAKWRARQRELDNEEAWRKANLRSRLSAKRDANKRGTKPAEEKDIIEIQLDTEERVEIQQIEEKADLIRQSFSQEAKLEAQILTQLNAPPNYDDTIDKVHAEFVKRSSERAKALEDESEYLRQRLKERLAKRARKGELAAPDETREMEVAVEVQVADLKRHVQIDNLMDKAEHNILTSDDEETIRKLREEHDARWAEKMKNLQDEATRRRLRLQERLAKRRAQASTNDTATNESETANKQLTVEDTALRNELEQELAVAQDNLLVARLLEKKQLGLLTTDDEALIRQIQEEYQNKWMERRACLEDEAAMRRQALIDRLAARRKAIPNEESSEVKAAIEAQLITEDIAANLDLENILKEQLEEIDICMRREASKLDKVEAPVNYDNEIQRLQAEHDRSCKERARMLQDEENRLRQRLKDRLAARKRLGDEVTHEELEQLQNGLSKDLEKKRELFEVENLMDKAKKKLLADNDEETIQKLKEEHANKWHARLEALKDEEEQRKRDLKNRLAKKRSKNLLSPASAEEKAQLAEAIDAEEAELLKDLSFELKEAQRQLVVGQLAEKATLNMLTQDDSALIKQIQDEHERSLRERQQEVQSEATAKKAALQARLAAKKHALLLSGKSADETVAIEKQIELQEATEEMLINATLEVKQQELKDISKTQGKHLTQIQLNFDDEILKLQEEYARKRKERESLLADEETRLRNRLKERLAMRKKHDGDSISQAEEAQLQTDLETEIQAERQKVELENLLDKAKLNLLTRDDEETIRRINEEHMRTSAKKREMLDDEESILKAKLAERLAKKREKIKNIPAQIQEAVIAQLDHEEDIEVRSIEASVDKKRKVLKETEQLIQGWTPKPDSTDHEQSINTINDEHEKHTKNRQRKLDEEEQLKKARLRERIEKKRKMREEALDSDRPTTAESSVEMNRELEKIDAEMASKREELEAEAEKERLLLASAVQNAKLEVDSIVEKVKKDHEANMESLKKNLEADRAKQELALKERIAARRKQKNDGKVDEEALAAQEAAERKALQAKLDMEAAEAIAKEKQRADEEIAALQREASKKAELQALQAAKEKQMAEDEWNRLKQTHETELKQLQITLESEQQRQESKLKDRIRLRREQKERELAKCKDEEEAKKIRDALEEQERLEKQKLAVQLAKQAEEALQEEMERQEAARKAAEAKLNQAAVEAAAATAAMDAYRASELERVSAEFNHKMSLLQQDTANEALTQKAKLEARMAARKQKKAMELEAKKEEEKKALLEKQRLETEALQARLAQAEDLAKVDEAIKREELQTPRAAETSEGVALAETQKAEREALEAKQAAEMNRLDIEAAKEQNALGRPLNDPLVKQMSASQEQLQVKKELDRVTTEFQEKLMAHTDSLEAESNQKKRDLMRRLEEKKKKKKEELLAKQKDELEAAMSAQKSEQEKLANKLEMEREVATIQKVLAQNTVVVSQLTSIIERVVERRHKREQSLLFAKQYRERAAVLRDALQALMQQKAKDKAALLEAVSDATDRERQIDELEASYRVKQQDIEATGTQDVEAAQSKEQASLKERQTADIAYLYQQFVGQCKPDVVVLPQAAAPANVSAAVVVDDTAGLRGHLELEKQARIDAILKESAAAVQKLRDGLSAEWKALDDEFITQMAQERKENNQVWQTQRQKIQEQAGNNEKRRQALLKALETEKTAQEASVEKMLKARVQKKKERKERVFKRRLKRLDDETKRKIEITNAQFLATLADELETLKNKDKMVKTPSVALLGLGKERLQNAVNRTKTLAKLGSLRQLTESPGEDETPRTARCDAEDQTMGHSRLGDGKEDALATKSITKISEKLDSIERLIQRLTNQGPREDTSPQSVKSALLAAYPGLEQDAKAPCGSLKHVDESVLAPRQKVRLEFGRKLLGTLGDSIRIAAATELPADSHGIFCHSMHFDSKANTLYVRQTRLESVPELALLIVHTVAHLKVHGAKFEDDNDIAFVSEFYRILGRCYQDFFSKMDVATLGTSDSLENLLTVPPKSLEAPSAYFLPNNIESRLADMQAFLDQMQSTEADDQVAFADHPTGLTRAPSSLHQPVSPRSRARREWTAPPRSFKKAGSSMTLVMANEEQQVASLQECLDVAEKSYMETLKRYTEISDAVELLEDALSDARAENVEHEITVLTKKLHEAKNDLARVTTDRDEVAQRCEKLRLEIKAKLMST
ncbi:unnamed protein product [Aphanomyces euteiches]